jgi:hypothetical protein
MKQFCTDIQFIDPNGNGIISTWIYQGANEIMAEKKAMKGFNSQIEKCWGINSGDIEITRITTCELKSGHFRDRKWNVR